MGDKLAQAPDMTNGSIKVPLHTGIGKIRKTNKKKRRSKNTISQQRAFSMNRLSGRGHSLADMLWGYQAFDAKLTANLITFVG